MPDYDYKLIAAALDRLIGRRCVGVVAGAGTGSVVSIDFEPCRPREVPVKNQLLTEAQRLTKPDFSLFVECAWRIESKLELICGSGDDDRNNGPMVMGLERLVGLKLERFQLSEPGLDLRLDFEDTLFMRVFCDQCESDYDNYSVFAPEEIWTVSARSRLSSEPNEECTP